MIKPQQLKELARLASLDENQEEDIDNLANKILDPKNRSLAYDFRTEFEEYQKILLDAVSEGLRRTILINQFDDNFGKRAMEKFRKMGFKIRSATKKEVLEWRGEEDEYRNKYSAFFISW